MSDCRFGVSPVNYPDPDPDTVHRGILLMKMEALGLSQDILR